jgi:hypothetical protein
MRSSASRGPTTNNEIDTVPALLRPRRQALDTKLGSGAGTVLGALPHPGRFTAIPSAPATYFNPPPRAGVPRQAERRAYPFSLLRPEYFHSRAVMRRSAQRPGSYAGAMMED